MLVSKGERWEEVEKGGWDAPSSVSKLGWSQRRESGGDAAWESWSSEACHGEDGGGSVSTLRTERIALKWEGQWCYTGLQSFTVQSITGRSIQTSNNTTRSHCEWLTVCKLLNQTTCYVTRSLKQSKYTHSISNYCLIWFCSKLNFHQVYRKNTHQHIYKTPN